MITLITPLDYCTLFKNICYLKFFLRPWSIFGCKIPEKTLRADVFLLIKTYSCTVFLVCMYSDLSNKNAANLILFEKFFSPTCLIRTSTFNHFWWIFAVQVTQIWFKYNWSLLEIFPTCTINSFKKNSFLHIISNCILLERCIL